jgi:hypothetical protein
MRRVSVHIAEDPDFLGRDESWMILPRPYDDWFNRFDSLEIDGIEAIHEVGAGNSLQRAYLVKPSPGRIPQINFVFEKANGRPPEWFWKLQSNRFTEASGELVAQATDLASGCRSEADCVRSLVDHAAGIFGYEHPDERFYEGHERVPVLCGTAKGSCVDINTYLIASSRCLGIKVQYVAGYWFHPDKNETPDMHCWLAFHCDRETLFWDLAHHLKWGVEELAPGLNPAGGRRVPMSCGRGLRFHTPNGEIEISHFSEPLWVLPDGSTHKPPMRIRIEEG